MRLTHRQTRRFRSRLLDTLQGQRSGEEGTDSLTFYWRGRTLRIHVEVSVFHYLCKRSLISGSEPVGDRDRRGPKIRFCEDDIRKDQYRNSIDDLRPSTTS